MSDLKFKDRVVLITGAGGGLGRAYALEFGKRGAKVVVNDLGGSIRGEGGSNSAADKVVEEIKAAGGIAVANYDSVENGAKIVDTAIKNFGRIDIIINNAGILRDVSFAKMTDQDWELLQKVHLNGTYAVTKAAWPHMLKQKYGRIIMVTSAAGLYGNFGQSHYSAVKMAVVGFANTLAQEGKKFNIRVNTIAPLAGSRMTETVLPPNLIAALKPEYVAPLVLYLCHETNDENGGIFEVGAGWISKVRWQRTNGVMFPLNEKFTIEAVADKIDAINDWKDATYPTTPRDAFGPIMANIEAGKAADNNAAPAPAAEEGGKKSKKGGGEDGGKKVDVATALAHNYPEIKYSYTEKELILYNLGIGAGSNPLDKSELNFIYEGADNFQAIPTFGVIPPAAALAEIINTPGLSFNPMMLLHGEQYLEVKKTIPTTGNLISKAKISNIYDKGSGALVVLDVKTFDDKGEELFFNQSSLFIRGIGGFGGKKGPSEKEENYEPPQCPPAVVHREKTMENQAALYRLSGDTNPLHIDPALASMGGFSSPILHGLCTFGYGARAVIKHFADNDFKRFKSIRARFVKSVYPGETLVTEMWPINNGNTIIFRVKVAERGDTVLAHAAIHLHPVAGTAAAATPSSSPAADAAPAAAAAPQSTVAFAMEPVFNELKARASAELVKRINAIFRFDIKKDSTTRHWLLDLKNGSGSVTEVTASTKADCIIGISDADCVNLFAGKLNAQQAFMKQQLTLKGNMMLAQKLQLLQSAPSKL